MLQEFDAIIIIRLSSLGDVVLSTAVLKAFRERFPRAHLSFITARRYADLIEHNPFIDDRVYFEDKNFIMGMMQIWGMRIKFGRGRNMLVDLHPSGWSPMRSSFWAFMLQLAIPARRKIKAKRKDFAALARGGAIGAAGHIVDDFYAALAELGPSAYSPPAVFLPEDEEPASRAIHSKEDGRCRIGVHPGASFPVKRWPEDRFAELCKLLQKEKGYLLTIFGSRKESELIHRIGKSVDTGKARLAIGLGLKEMIRLIDECDIFIANDSGLMHLAAARGVPVISIFGPTHPKLGFRPVGDGNVALYSDVPCSPCSRWGEKRCKLKRSICFDDIGTAKVLEAVEKMVNTKRDPASLLCIS
ncbi:MAG: glycosyltransferase family 9 protein [Candidatus Omnitrophota bacterium]